MAQLLETLTQVMGGDKVFPNRPMNEGDFARQIRTGLPVNAIDALMEQFNLTSEELVNPLGISIATIRRRHKQPHLTPPVSDRLYRVARIISIAADTLGSREKAARWLHKPNRALSGETPLSRLDTTIGYQQVEEVLFHIDQGLVA